LSTTSFEVAIFPAKSAVRLMCPDVPMQTEMEITHVERSDLLR